MLNKLILVFWPNPTIGSSKTWFENMVDTTKKVKEFIHHKKTWKIHTLTDYLPQQIIKKITNTPLPITEVRDKNLEI